MEKNELYNQMLLMWLWAELHNMSIVSCLKNKGFENVAIYGMGGMGECLYYELYSGGINIRYVIDRNDTVLCDCPVLSPNSDWFPDVDIIIITVENEFQEISKMLVSKTKAKLLSLQQLLCNVTGLVL